MNRRRKRRNKHNNKRVKYKGLNFASKWECQVYLLLKDLQAKTEDMVINLQPRYLLQEGFMIQGKRIRKMEYVADFEILINGKVYVLDAKGFETAVFKIKKKLFEKKYNKPIILIKNVKDFNEWVKETKRGE